MIYAVNAYFSIGDDLSVRALVNSTALTMLRCFKPFIISSIHKTVIYSISIDSTYIILLKPQRETNGMNGIAKRYVV